jgi:hypothetical protein
MEGENNSLEDLLFAAVHSTFGLELIKRIKRLVNMEDESVSNQTICLDSVEFQPLKDAIMSEFSNKNLNKLLTEIKLFLSCCQRGGRCKEHRL